MKTTTKQFVSNIPVEEISEEGFYFAYEDMPGLLTDAEDCSPCGPIRGEAVLQRVGADVHVTGNIAAEVNLTCHRCLSIFQQRTEASFSYVVVMETAGEEEEVHLRKDDLNVTYCDGNEVKMGELFHEQMLLQLPMRQLCRQDCRGLCPGCGADLNTESCRCEEQSHDTPFVVLKKLQAPGR